MSLKTTYTQASTCLPSVFRPSDKLERCRCHLMFVQSSSSAYSATLRLHVRRFLASFVMVSFGGVAGSRTENRAFRAWGGLVNLPITLFSDVGEQCMTSHSNQVGQEGFTCLNDSSKQHLLQPTARLPPVNENERPGRAPLGPSPPRGPRHIHGNGGRTGRIRR